MGADSYAHLAFLRTDEDAAEAIVRFRNVDVNNTTARRVHMRWFLGKLRGLSAESFETKMAIAQVDVFNQLTNKRRNRVSAQENAKMVEWTMWYQPDEDPVGDFDRHAGPRHVGKYPWVSFPRPLGWAEDPSLLAEPAYEAWRAWRAPVRDSATGQLIDRYRAMRKVRTDEGLAFLKQACLEKPLCIKVDEQATQPTHPYMPRQLAPLLPSYLPQHNSVRGMGGMRLAARQILEEAERKAKKRRMDDAEPEPHDERVGRGEEGDIEGKQGAAKTEKNDIKVEEAGVKIEED